MKNDTIVRDRITKWEDKFSTKTAPETIENEIRSLISDVKSMLDTDLVKQA